ncbi:signal peptide peptidase-domain-containing protein [Apodospora peruviana]|uniref:Signal peptide peptidase-domain-containing protein n=1 Tax=Apodospora peruviana TaxID=516989 RepID=A0AAE0MFG2_9PEZI|nr:signal peptide peptidase-domain-containing protein [Apodospora peruviana]
MSSENITANATDGSSNSTGTLPHIFSFPMLLKPDFLLIEAQVILSALSIIWLGAHASLRRPPSAAPAKLKKGKKKPKDDQFTEGFTASDAIMLPIMAGAVLMGLYYLIKWLQNPALLNKILRVYLSVASVASLGRLAADALEFLTSLIFPSVWADRSGRIYHIDSVTCRQYLVLDGQDTGTETPVPAKKTPFAGPLSEAKLSKKFNRVLWGIRHLLKEEWKARFVIHGLVKTSFDLKLNTILGLYISVFVTIVYYLTSWHVASNLLGAAFSYAAFTLMSPTSFGIGTAVLAGLFIYDIVMVFYTPFMITVAKTVDAPIKLVFQGSSGVSMLGLGDIVVPGLLMGLALRFDLHQHYQKKIKHEPVQLTSESADGLSGTTVTTTETQYRQVKAPYVDPQGQWGTRFWTTSFRGIVPFLAAGSVKVASSFPKPYFYASVAGYALGMILTLTMLLVFNHGQPALLYLVPGVTGSVWLTGLFRGELKDMWAYTEDGSLDTEDVVVELDANGAVVKEVSKKTKSQEDSKPPRQDAAADSKPAAARSDEGYDGHDVFLFSITAPRDTVKRD